MNLKFQYPLYIHGIYQVYSASRNMHGIYMVYTDYIPHQGSDGYCGFEYRDDIVEKYDIGTYDIDGN
jgi:hypothetical protein